MKKLIVFLLLTVYMFTLCACENLGNMGTSRSEDGMASGGSMHIPVGPTATGGIIINPDDIVGNPDNDPDSPGDNTDNPEVPGDDPVDPGDDPVDPGDDPVDPGDDPVDPGDDPVDPGDEPVDPGDDPADPGDDPVDPDDDPGMECDHVPYIHTTMDLSVYGGCEGSVLYMVCCQCRQYGYVDAEFNCMPGNDKINTYYMDENGVEHTVFHIQCRDCELDFYSDTTETVTGCVLDITEYVRVNIGEDWNLLDIRYSNQEEHHDFAYSIQMCGTSCTDGFLEGTMCRNCSATEEVTYYEYHKVYPVEKTQLETYNTCGGYMEYSVCNCGQVESYDFIHNCVFWAYSLGEPEWRDEEGILHEISYHDCEYCDLLVKSDNYLIVEGCTAYAYSCSTAKIGDIVLYENVTSLLDVVDYHDNEAFIEMRGDTCADGFVHTYVCRRCGAEVVHDSEVEGYDYDPHIMFLTEEVFLSDVGICGGWFVRYTCCCGYYDDCTVTLYCDNTSTEIEWEYDENGFERRTHTTKCADCDLLMVEYFYTEVRDCVAYHYCQFSLYCGDTTIVHEATHMYSSEVHHTYETTYELMGESCTDGVEAVSTCIYCGSSTTDYFSEHKWCVTTEIHLSEYGCCEGIITLLQCLCKADGTVVYELSGDFSSLPGEQFTDENGVEHSVQTSVCNTCGLIIQNDWYYVEENGEVIRYRREIVKTKDGIVLLDMTRPF